MSVGGGVIRTLSDIYDPNKHILAIHPLTASVALIQKPVN